MRNERALEWLLKKSPLYSNTTQADTTQAGDYEKVQNERKGKAVCEMSMGLIKTDTHTD